MNYTMISTGMQLAADSGDVPFVYEEEWYTRWMDQHFPLLQSVGRSSVL
jgi:hypothetical protein